MTSLTPLPTVGEMLRHFGLCLSGFGADQDEEEQRRRDTLRKRLLQITSGIDMPPGATHCPTN